MGWTSRIQFSAVTKVFVFHSLSRNKSTDREGKFSPQTSKVQNGGDIYLHCSLRLQILACKHWRNSTFTSLCLCLFRLHPFDHTPRKLLPFVRGWFFTSISAFQRELLPQHTMTNPAEGRSLCARQTLALCSRTELCWTNPHTH